MEFRNLIGMQRENNPLNVSAINHTGAHENKYQLI